MGDFLWRQTFPANLAQNSSLSAVSWAPDRWDVFGTYADGTLQHWWFENGNTGFDPVIVSGLIPAGGLCAMALEPERLDVFGVGAPLGAQLGDLQHVWYPPPPGNEQFGQESLSGKLAVLAEANYAQPRGGPSAVLLAGPGPSELILQVFAISSGGDLLRWTLDEPSQPETITLRCSSGGGTDPIRPPPQGGTTGVRCRAPLRTRGRSGRRWPASRGPRMPWTCSAVTPVVTWCGTSTSSVRRTSRRICK